ncbi:predicted protein [Lichtheimia corymbifera JMRC:FSU:9682]|uniref:DASH complex subunit DUO1 n=1 Tax=Lichtheimia corymbifera JMRC:FSU:9682 TaxID=1263082 RepID=A0A068S4I6_9FUNG|nr:predicted protein [Lichtheimia corymbifera JMRC:FSU:9682]
MEPRHDRDQAKTPTHRQSLPLTAGRRATILFRTLDHSQPPVANPNNPPEVNTQLQREYENICKLNEAMETVIDNFNQTRESIQNFSQTVDQTEQLLDLWASILSQSEHTRLLLENERWQGISTPPLAPRSQPSSSPSSSSSANQLQQPQQRYSTLRKHEPSRSSLPRTSTTTRIPVRRTTKR